MRQFGKRQENNQLASLLGAQASNWLIIAGLALLAFLFLPSLFSRLPLDLQNLMVFPTRYPTFCLILSTFWLELLTRFVVDT